MSHEVALHLNVGPRRGSASCGSSSNGGSSSVTRRVGTDGKRQSSEVILRRGDITVTVTVPHAVLEWFVLVEDAEETRIEDWAESLSSDPV